MNHVLKTFVAGAALTFAGSAGAGVLYSQPYDGTGVLYASQNDPGGSGNFATSYEDFTVSSATFLDGFDFTGGYFNPGAPGSITAFTVTIYDDASGIPGAPIAAGTFPGNGGETLIGGNIDSYSIFFANFEVAAGTYWVSFVPTMSSPPQWGWATSATGNDNAYQCFAGSCSDIGVNLAFDVLGSVVAPEPGTWALMLVGFGGLGAALRTRRARPAAV